MGSHALIQVLGGASIVSTIGAPDYVNPKVLVSFHCFEYLEIDWLKVLSKVEGSKGLSWLAA